MMKFLQPGSVSATPKSWRSTVNGKDYRIPWDPRNSFQQFVATVQAFTQANNLPVPSADELEDMMCRQLPRGHCSGGDIHRPPPIRAVQPCSSCGRR